MFSAFRIPSRAWDSARNFFVGGGIVGNRFRSSSEYMCTRTEYFCLTFANICIGVILFFIFYFFFFFLFHYLSQRTRADSYGFSFDIPFICKIDHLVESRTSDANDLFSNQYLFREAPSVIGLQISAGKIDYARLNVTLPSTVSRSAGEKISLGILPAFPPRFYSSLFARKRNTEPFIVSIVTVSITQFVSCNEF